MKYNPDIHHRRSIRLQGYDYSRIGKYFITIRTHNRQCIFGDVMDRVMVLNDAGRMVENCWNDIPAHFPHAELDEWVIMPNHAYGIVSITMNADDNGVGGIRNENELDKIRMYTSPPKFPKIKLVTSCKNGKTIYGKLIFISGGTVPVKKLLFILLIIPLIVYILYLSRAIISPFIMAFFLAYAINPLVEFLQRRGARREYAILTIYLIVFLVMALVLLIVVPRLVEDLTKLLKRLPDIYEEIEMLGGRFNQFYWRLPINIKTIVAGITKRMETLLRNTLIQLAETTVNLLSKALLFILVPVLAYYINRDYPILKKKGYHWLTENLGYHWTRTFLKFDSVLKIYIRGQMLTTMIVGVLIGVGLSILGFEAAILLGLIAGVLNLIPYFGPVLGAAPAVIFALLKSPWNALYVAVLFLVVNQLEVLVLVPRIIGGSLQIHPITVVYLVLVGSRIGGLVGMVFAVPLGAIFLILIKSIYEIAFGLANNEPISEKLKFNPPELD